MKTIFGRKADMSDIAYRDLSAYRYEVFVNRLGWPLDCPVGQELDQFDRADTEYVLARQDDGAICGCARLLPTDHPYLLGEVFPVLMHGQPLPSDASVWEVSRFATWASSASGPDGADTDGDLMRTRLLARAVLDRAADLGAKRLITVSPYGMERLLRRVGVEARRSGPPVLWGGQLLIACWIDVQA
ncbi:MAG: N-acylhomoserine lactone synthase [Aquabacterium sp.]|nr:N-acylhomoserine lactone synthase [Aquabacterium sp.]